MAEASQRGSLFPDFEIRAEDTVVDVGCGEGADSLLAGRLGAAVIALDIEPYTIYQLDEAMRDVPARSYRAITSDCHPIPLPDAVADVVICKEVLEHVEAPGLLLGELARIGKPGARYLLSVPDPVSESLLATVAPAWYFQRPFHVQVFDHDRLDALIRDAGLTIEHRAYCGAYDSLWWAMRFAVDVDFDPSRDPYAPPPPILDEWERLWTTIRHSPGGAALAKRFDTLLPKSQVITARKVPAPVHRPLGRPHWLRFRRGALVPRSRQRADSIRPGKAPGSAEE